MRAATKIASKSPHASSPAPLQTQRLYPSVWPKLSRHSASGLRAPRPPPSPSPPSRYRRFGPSRRRERNRSGRKNGRSPPRSRSRLACYSTLREAAASRRHGCCCPPPLPRKRRRNFFAPPQPPAKHGNMSQLTEPHRNKPRHG